MTTTLPSHLEDIRDGLIARAESHIVEAVSASQGDQDLPRQWIDHWNAACVEGLIAGMARAVIATSKDGHEVKTAEIVARLLVRRVHQLTAAGSA